MKICSIKNNNFILIDILMISIDQFHKENVIKCYFLFPWRYLNTQLHLSYRNWPTIDKYSSFLSAISIQYILIMLCLVVGKAVHTGMRRKWTFSFWLFSISIIRTCFQAYFSNIENAKALLHIIIIKICHFDILDD